MSAISAPLMPAAVPSAVLSLAEDHHPIAVDSAPAERKRRREDEEDSDDACTVTETAPGAGSATDGNTAILLPSPLVAAQPIVTVLPSRGGISSNKRPQLKYDPSVPMTREQTSAWRREQRRKRNRESAAACRRRQRELVSVLEVEVASWRHRFEYALAMVRTRDGGDAAAALEAELERAFVLQPRRTTEEDYGERDSPSPPPPRPFPDEARSSYDTMIDHDVTNIVSPSHDRTDKIFVTEHRLVSSGDEDLHFPILEDHIKVESTDFTGENPTDQHPIVIKSRAENRRHLNELITTSAVKIAGDVDPPTLDLINIESVCDDLLQVVPDICLLPDGCLSLMEKKTMPFPEACPSLVPSAIAAGSSAAADVLMSAATSDESVPGVSTDESGDDEEDDCNDLGEFLLDAAQWLL